MFFQKVMLSTLKLFHWGSAVSAATTGLLIAVVCFYCRGYICLRIIAWWSQWEGTQ